MDRPQAGGYNVYEIALAAAHIFATKDEVKGEDRREDGHGRASEKLTILGFSNLSP